MRNVLALAAALVLTGCATRLPTTAPSSVAASDATATPARGLETRFVRCETEGMVKEYEAEEERLRHHKLNLFLGYTGERGHGGGQTVGLDYLYRFNEHWGVGAFIDLAAGGMKTRVLGAGLDFHPIEAVFLFVGPGVEWVDGESQGLIRVGTGYEIELGERLSTGPALYIDFLEDGEFAWVAGVLLSYGI